MRIASFYWCSGWLLQYPIYRIWGRNVILAPRIHEKWYFLPWPPPDKSGGERKKKWGINNLFFLVFLHKIVFFFFLFFFSLSTYHRLAFFFSFFFLFLTCFFNAFLLLFIYLLYVHVFPPPLKNVNLSRSFKQFRFLLCFGFLPGISDFTRTSTATKGIFFFLTEPIQWFIYKKKKSPKPFWLYFKLWNMNSLKIRQK